MEDQPLVTIVHNDYNSFCRLLVIYDSKDYFYSYDTEYKNLIHFKDSPKVIKYDDKYVVFSKNLKGSIVLRMRSGKVY